MKYFWGAMAAAAAILLSLCGVTAHAQTSSATISGYIVDQSKAVVPHAQVRLVNQLTGVTITTQSRANGQFLFLDVQPGTFAVVVDAPGYKEMRKTNLRLRASQNLSAGVITLEIGQVSQSVTVRADITPLQTTSTERSGVLDTKQLDNLLAIGRDPMAMLRVLPGVVGSEGASSLGTSGTPVINGVNNEYNLATIDGVTGNTRGLSTLDTPINLDAVKEVTVLDADYQAEYGKTAGSNLNFVTKNGTQHFHGGLYYYVRNEAFNANSWFNNYTGKARSRYRFNTIGGTIGGPVYWPSHFNTNKDKLFFFVSVEYDPTTSPDGLKYYTVPTLAQVNGDFSQTYNQGTTATQGPSTLIRIRNPDATGSCPVNSATPGPGCFQNNIIPSGMINPQAKILLQTMYNNTLKKYPANAFNNLAISGNNYNYITNNSSDRPVNQEIFRIDYAPTEALHMYGRGDLEAVNDNGFSSPANYLPWLMKVNYRTTNPNFAFNITYTFSPTLVNELNLGTSGWSETQLYNKADLDQVTLSSSGLDLPSLYSGVNPMNLFPGASFGGVTDAATYRWDSRFPMTDQVRTYTATDNVTKVIGNHILKFGVDAETDSYLQVNHNRVGTFAFGRDTKNPYDDNFAYANALLGTVDNYSQVTQLINYKPRTNGFEWYEQDSWQVRPTLLLYYGIRNSWAMAQRLAIGNNFVPSLFKPGDAPVLYNYTSTGQAVDPTTGKTYPGAYAGLFVPNTGNINNGVLYTNTPGYPQGTVYGNGVLWAPRVGFSWSVRPETVVRGGFGMFYNVRARSGQEGDLTNNAPTTNSVTQFYSSINSNASNYYVNGGGLIGPFSVDHAIPLHAHQLYTEQASLGVQQQLNAGIVMDIAYVGTFTKHASDYTPINEVPYGAEFQLQNQKPGGGILPDNFFRPYPGFGTINMQYFNLTANYNSLQAQLTRRFAHGLEFGVAYTYSKSMDYTDSYNGTVAMYQNLRAWNYGPAGWDRRNNLVVNYLWSIPRASHLWNNGGIRAVLDGWQISGIASYVSGAPGSIGLSTSNGANITGGGDGARVELSCDPMEGAPHKFGEWFNTACVHVPLAGKAATATTPAILGQTGNAPKVNYFNPGDTDFDTALFKNIPIEGRATVQFRLETYNTFNHPEFNGVNSTAKFANANSSANPQTDTTFGRLSSTLNPRELQLAVRINF